VQLRLKGASDVDVLRAAERLLPLCAPRDVAFIVNDRPDLALAAGADGVHIGQEDAPFDEARRILGLGRIVGVTCHDSRHLAVEAADAGADYVAFGAFFPTATKEAKGHPEPELLAWWSDIMTVPCVAIGGIDAANCAPLVAAGADFLAVSSGVWAHPQGPAEGVRALNAAIAKAAEERPR
jgi:thiamine-phosphate pyrophosphorylase